MSVTRTEELQSRLEHVLAAPADEGSLELIVRRPEVGERELIETAQLDTEQGLVGDRWAGASPETQLTLMNIRVIELLEDDPERWPLAGDQLFVDFDLTGTNVPPGTRLAVGDTIVEVSAVPHTGCKKFAARFGVDAVAFISTPENKARNLRGINAKVVVPGEVRRGDTVRKLP